MTGDRNKAPPWQVLLQGLSGVYPPSEEESGIKSVSERGCWSWCVLLEWDCLSPELAEPFLAPALSLYKAFEELLLGYSGGDEGRVLLHVQQNFLLPALILVFVCLLVFKFLLCF